MNIIKIIKGKLELRKDKEVLIWNIQYRPKDLI